MPTNKTRGPTTPDQQFEELMLKDRATGKERQAVNEYNLEDRAIATAEYNDEDATQTASGAMITRHEHSSKRRRSKRLRGAFCHNNGFANAAEAIVDSLFTMATAGLMGSLKTTDSGEGMSGLFGDKVRQTRTSLQPAHEDENFIYDTMHVSRPVYDKLLKESEIITEKLERLEALKKNPNSDKMTDVIEQMSKDIEKMADEFEMRVHPITKAYVHDYNRVLREEKICTKNHDHRLDTPQVQELKVCIYRIKVTTDELKGVTSKVADQFDDKPEELQVSGDQFKGAAPALIPVGP